MMKHPSILAHRRRFLYGYHFAHVIITQAVVDPVLVSMIITVAAVPEYNNLASSDSVISIEIESIQFD